jgi:hypothetical protein
MRLVLALFIGAAAVVVTPGPVQARAQVSTASRAQCIATGQVCTKVAGHTRPRLTLVFRTRRVRKKQYGLCVRTPRHPRAAGISPSEVRGAKKFSLCRDFQLRKGSQDAKFDRVPNGFRSRVPYNAPPFPYTGPGRYFACWTWGESCANAHSPQRLELTRMVFWIKRDGRVIVRR